MDTSLLQQPLTSKAALEWLEDTLDHSEDEDDWTDPDHALSAILECDWNSEEEFLEFFKEISIQLARSASKSSEEETAEIFGAQILSGLSLSSPYYELWEKAFATENPALKDEASVREWDSELDPSIETMKLAALIPHAMAYEPTIFEAIRNRTIVGLTYNEEEFLGYLASSLLPGYYDGLLPVEIVRIPSSRILGEIFDDWMMYQDLWKPEVIREALESEYADQSVKEKIARVLKGECESDPESWEMHREAEWTEEDLEELLQLCE